MKAKKKAPIKKVKEKKTGETYSSKKAMAKHEKGEPMKKKMMEGEMKSMSFKKGGKKC
jgi:hypothetical protein